MEKETKHTPLESMVWPITHNRGDFFAVGIALDDVKALYHASNGTSSLIEAYEETIIDKTKLIKELQTELSEMKKQLESKPFLGWTTDKDVLNQQREYWGAMNGLSEMKKEREELRAEVDRIKNLIFNLPDGAEIQYHAKRLSEVEFREYLDEYLKVKK